MSSKVIAEHLEASPSTVANLCSEMVGRGVLVEHPNEHGGRRGRRYGVADGVEAVPADVALVAALVAAYGADLVAKMARAS
jgi:hypothetical protein